MRRVISLFLPLWPSDRLRRVSNDAPARGRPLVTALMQGQRRVLASVDDAAAHAGLACGMTVTHAQSLVPDLCVVNGTPEEDEAALLRLALWCIRYSPLVTPDPPDGIFIDVAGSAHLFHGEAALLRDLRQRLTAQGVTSRAAIADTPGCARAVARFGGTAIVSPGRASEAVVSLPVGALRLPNKINLFFARCGDRAHCANRQQAARRPSPAFWQRRAAAFRSGPRISAGGADVPDST
jgi:protein ImuB